MKCLCCGKPLRTATESGWHQSCIQRFFGTKKLPELMIDDQALESLALETTGKGFTVPGVQKKLSLHLMSEGATARLTLVNYPTGYILKPQVSELESLPEAEHLVMSLAELAGISTVPHALIQGSQGLAYITRRIDRRITAAGVHMLAMEDFCQLDHRLTQDKYLGSYERCAKLIQRYSARVGYDLAEFFARILFSFLVGNSDMHLKNFSLIETLEDSGAYVLSPAYDLLPVNVILPEDQEQMALALNGKKTNLRRNDFLKFTDVCGIPKASAEKMMHAQLKLVPRFIELVAQSLLPSHLKEQMTALISQRANALEKPELS